jgi:hypothetical protein
MLSAGTNRVATSRIFGVLGLETAIGFAAVYVGNEIGVESYASVPFEMLVQFGLYFMVRRVAPELLHRLNRAVNAATPDASVEVGYGALAGAAVVGAVLALGLYELVRTTDAALKEHEAEETSGVFVFVVPLALLAFDIARSAAADLANRRPGLIVLTLLGVGIAYATAWWLVDILGPVYFAREAKADSATTLDYLGGAGLKERGELDASRAGDLFALTILLLPAYALHPFTLVLNGVRRAHTGVVADHRFGAAGGAIAGAMAMAILTADRPHDDVAVTGLLWAGIIGGAAVGYAVSSVGSALATLIFRQSARSSG